MMAIILRKFGIVYTWEFVFQSNVSFNVPQKKRK
jgi:hypothetical protein